MNDSGDCQDFSERKMEKLGGKSMSYNNAINHLKLWNLTLCTFVKIIRHQSLITILPFSLNSYGGELGLVVVSFLYRIFKYILPFCSWCISNISAVEYGSKVRSHIPRVCMVPIIALSCWISKCSVCSQWCTLFCRVHILRNIKKKNVKV